MELRMQDNSYIQFVSYDEVEIAKIHNQTSDIENNKSNHQIIITNKRIYSNSNSDNNKHENIINLDTVGYVNIIYKKLEKHISFLAFFSIVAIIVGIILAFTVNPILALLSAIGLVCLIISLIKGQATYECKLIIGSSSFPIEIDVDDMNPQELRDIQQKILIAKDEIIKQKTPD